MSNKALKDLLQAYKSLPYLLHKNKYLIPQKPRSPYLRPPSLVKKPLEALTTYFPDRLTPDLIEESQKDKAQLAAHQLYFKLYEQTKQEHAERAKAHQERYIDGIKGVTRALSPDRYYFWDNREEITSQLRKQKKIPNFKEIKLLFDELPAQKKTVYEQIAKQDHKKRTKIQNEVFHECMLPISEYLHPHILYLQEKNPGKVVNPQMYGQYKELPQKIKNQYSQKSKKLREQDKQVLIKFLSKKGLTKEQFEIIKKVCTLIAKAKKDKKSELKKEKSERDSDNDEGFKELMTDTQIGTDELMSLETSESMDEIDDYSPKHFMKLTKAFEQFNKAKQEDKKELSQITGEQESEFEPEEELEIPRNTK